MINVQCEKRTVEYATMYKFAQVIKSILKQGEPISLLYNFIDDLFKKNPEQAIALLKNQEILRLFIKRSSSLFYLFVTHLIDQNKELAKNIIDKHILTEIDHHDVSPYQLNSFLHHLLHHHVDLFLLMLKAPITKNHLHLLKKVDDNNPIFLCAMACINKQPKDLISAEVLITSVLLRQKDMFRQLHQPFFATYKLPVSKELEQFEKISNFIKMNRK